MALWRKPRSEARATTSTETPAPCTGRDQTIRESQELRLGSAVHIRGELTGTQDVVLEGTAEGQVNLPDHAFTVGRTAHVAAEISARRVTVRGHVTGNIVATDIVLIASSGDVDGNVSAPRVVLADGCTFNGGVNHIAPRTPTVKIIRQAQPAQQAQPVQQAEPVRQSQPAQPRQPQPKRKAQPAKTVEQCWSSDGGAFWTMSRPYDEQASKRRRPTRARTPKAYDRLPADVTVEILDS